MNAWNKTTNAGATIKTALDYAMTIPATGLDASYAAELYPPIAAVASVYGDPGNVYTNFLAKAEGDTYVKDANFFWNQPLSDHGYSQIAAGSTTTMSAGKGSSTGSAPTGRSTVGTRPDNAAFRLSIEPWSAWGMLHGTCALVMVALFVDFL